MRVSSNRTSFQISVLQLCLRSDHIIIIYSLLKLCLVIPKTFCSSSYKRILWRNISTFTVFLAPINLWYEVDALTRGWLAWWTRESITRSCPSCSRFASLFTSCQRKLILRFCVVCISYTSCCLLTVALCVKFMYYGICFTRTWV